MTFEAGDQRKYDQMAKIANASLFRLPPGNIAGRECCSMVDWPGKISSVIFLQGCNFRCPWCYNKALAPLVTIDVAHLETMRARLAGELRLDRFMLDGVTISGGEPTLEPELGELIDWCHSQDLSVKLDTNGSRPEVLQCLLSGTKHRPDFVAMDLKAPFSTEGTGLADYRIMTGGMSDGTAVAESLSILRGARIKYQLKTTAAPGIGQAELEAIRKQLLPGEAWVVQPFRSPENTAHLTNKGCVDSF